MVHGYFHIRQGVDLIEDPEGGTFANWQLAHAEAVLAARELVINAIQAKQLIDDHQLEIHDAHGKMIAIIRLVDVLPLQGRPFALV